jgi:hypothetical protein
MQILVSAAQTPGINAISPATNSGRGEGSEPLTLRQKDWSARRNSVRSLSHKMLLQDHALLGLISRRYIDIHGMNLV